MMIKNGVILIAEKNGVCKLTHSRGPTPLLQYGWMVSQNEPGFVGDRICNLLDLVIAQ